MEIQEAIDKGVKKLAELSLEGHPFYVQADIYHKPASHEQMCYVCRKNLKKGDLVLKEQCGATRSGYSQYIYAHLDCFLAMLFHTITKVDGDK